MVVSIGQLKSKIADLEKNYKYCLHRYGQYDESKAKDATTQLAAAREIVGSVSLSDTAEAVAMTQRVAKIAIEIVDSIKDQFPQYGRTFVPNVGFHGELLSNALEALLTIRNSTVIFQDTRLEAGNIYRECKGTKGLGEIPIISYQFDSKQDVTSRQLDLLNSGSFVMVKLKDVLAGMENEHGMDADFVAAKLKQMRQDPETFSITVKDKASGYDQTFTGAKEISNLIQTTVGQLQSAINQEVIGGKQTAATTVLASKIEAVAGFFDSIHKAAKADLDSIRGKSINSDGLPSSVVSVLNAAHEINDRNKGSLLDVVDKVDRTLSGNTSRADLDKANKDLLGLIQQRDKGDKEEWPQIINSALQDTFKSEAKGLMAAAEVVRQKAQAVSSEVTAVSNSEPSALAAAPATQRQAARA